MHMTKKYCRNTAIEEQSRMYQFMRDIAACRDWYDRDSHVFYQEMNYVILFLAAN